MRIDRKEVEDHYKTCPIFWAQECPVCKPYINGLVEATAALKKKVDLG